MRALALFAVTLALGCTSPELVVVIDADPEVRETIETLVLEVDGVEVQRTAEEKSWPTLVRLEVASAREVTLTARALRGGRAELVTRGSVTLPSSGRDLVRLHFFAGCVPGVADAPVCDERQRCECTLECECTDQLGLTREGYDAESVRDGGQVALDAGTCFNGVMDGEETAIDCGGGSCPGCLRDQPCRVDEDCDSQVCQLGTCRPEECGNGILDGFEFATDCGGGACAGCPEGDPCEEDRHCGSRVCQEFVCRPATCGNGALDDEETDFDCGGVCGGCAAECGDGACACQSPSDCLTRACRGAGTCRDGCFASFGLECDEVETTYLKAQPPRRGSAFGTSMAFAGEWLFVGGPFLDGGVDVFRRSETGSYGWHEFIPPPEPGVRFGQSVASDGETLVVGAPGTDCAGAVHVYRRSGESWVVAPIDLPFTPARHDNAGAAVALADGWIAVGSPHADGLSCPDDDFTDEPGGVLLFRAAGASWVRHAEIEGVHADDRLGSAVALSGDTLAVAARNDDNGGGQAGSVRVLRRAGVGASATWSLEAYLQAETPRRISHFGASISLVGDLLAVGENDEDRGGRGVNPPPGAPDRTGSGAAHLFERRDGVWSEVAYLKAPNRDERDSFGASVPLFGQILVVGANDEDGDGSLFAADPESNRANGSGAAYVFREIDGVGWWPTLYFKAPAPDENDRFGRTLAFHEGVLAVAADFEDSGSTTDPSDDSVMNSGAVFLYDFTPAASAEVCDGFDNDVDDLVDEEAPECSVPCVSGACVPEG